MGIWIVLAVALAIAVYAVAIYNRLVKFRNRVENGWGDIQVQLKRRYDLIPNLVETVKGYKDYEQGVLESVIQARNAAQANNGSPESQAQTENVLVGGLRQLFALAEAYPDLKANTTFVSLQNDLADTENRIEAARRYYNATVRDLNTSIEQFPDNLIAGRFGFQQAQYFQLDGPDDPAKDPVKVAF